MSIGPTEQPTTLTLNVDDAAKLIGCAPRWLYNQARAKAVPHVKLGSRAPRFTRAHIDQIIAANERGRTDPLAQPARSHTARRKP